MLKVGLTAIVGMEVVIVTTSVVSLDLSKLRIMMLHKIIAEESSVAVIKKNLFIDLH